MMGLAPSELEHVTPYQFNLMREGYARDQESKWKRTRLTAYWTYVMAGKVVESPASIEEFLPLSDEDLKVSESIDLGIKKYTPEQEKALNEFFNQ